MQDRSGGEGIEPSWNVERQSRPTSSTQAAGVVRPALTDAPLLVRPTSKRDKAQGPDGLAAGPQNLVMGTQSAPNCVFRRIAQMRKEAASATPYESISGTSIPALGFFRYLLRRSFSDAADYSVTAPSLPTRRPTRASAATESTTVLRGLLRRETPEETSHRAPDLGLHQLTNDRDDALLSRHPPPPSYAALPYPRLDQFANASCESASLVIQSVPGSCDASARGPTLQLSGKNG
jgi:hypothetical protein